MESIVVSASVLNDSVPLAFELMTDIVMNPAFAETEIQRLKQQAMSGLSASMEDPDFLANAAFQQAIYGSHPYGQLEWHPAFDPSHHPRAADTLS